MFSIVDRFKKIFFVKKKTNQEDEMNATKGQTTRGLKSTSKARLEDSWANDDGERGLFLHMKHWISSL